MALYISILLFVLNLNLPTLALAAAAAAAAAAQCPPRYVFDENIPLHTSSCSAITLCVNDDGSMYLPTDDNIDAPCVSMLIALRCPEVVVVLPDADGEDGADDEGGVVERKCEYSVLRWDEKGLASQVCCGSFDVVFKEPEEDYGDEGEFDGGEFDDGEEEEEEEEEGGEDFEDEDENDQGEFDEEHLEEDEVAQGNDGVDYDEEDTAGGDYEEGDYDEKGDYEQEEDDEAAEHEDL